MTPHLGLEGISDTPGHIGWVGNNQIKNRRGTKTGEPVRVDKENPVGYPVPSSIGSGDRNSGKGPVQTIDHCPGQLKGKDNGNYATAAAQVKNPHLLPMPAVPKCGQSPLQEQFGFRTGMRTSGETVKGRDQNSCSPRM